MARLHEYSSDEIRVRYDAGRCIHAAECIRGLPGVFEKDRRPWVDPSEGDPDEIARVIQLCPTGALTYERLDGGPAETPPARAVAALMPDGPIFVHGDLEVRVSGQDEPLRQIRVALCRCGASSNEPFCDNSHVEAGFTDPGEADSRRAADAPADSASLTIRPLPNGPCMVAGVLDLVDGDGIGRMRVENPTLCRCGHSQDKPFCDGSHSSAGFQAD